jgi:hypothetical protein
MDTQNRTAKSQRLRRDTAGLMDKLKRIDLISDGTRCIVSLQNATKMRRILFGMSIRLVCFEIYLFRPNGKG